jgi:hypothetical protein
LQGIFGVLLVTDNAKNPSSYTLSVPPAKLGKSLVIT